IKFVMILAILQIVFSGYNASQGAILAMSVILSTSYIGDLFILPRMSNWLATIADFGIMFFGIWGLGFLLIPHHSPMVIPAYTAATLIAMGEILFHIQMRQHVIGGKVHRAQITRGTLQTEFSEELDPDQTHD